jgi:hypothetical protein
MYTFTPTARPQIESRLRRIVDLTVPNFNRQPPEQRFDSRSNRVIPVVICPWQDDKAAADKHMFALTKDISSDSVGIVLPQPLVGEEVVVGFWLGAETMDEPWYFLGHAQAQREIGGGFWTVGVQFTEFLSQSNRDGIVPLAKLAHLLPAPAHEG